MTIDSKERTTISATLNAKQSNCDWLISSPNQTRIVLNPITFERGGVIDYLWIGNYHNSSNDESRIAKIDGAIPTVVVTSGNMIWIKFVRKEESTKDSNMTITMDLYKESGQFQVLFCLFVL